MNQNKLTSDDVRFSALKHRIFFSLTVNLALIAFFLFNASAFIYQKSYLHLFLISFLIFQTVVSFIISIRYQYRYFLIWSSLLNVNVLFYLYLFTESSHHEMIPLFISYPAVVFFLGKFRYGGLFSLAGLLSLLTVYYFELPFQKEMDYEVHKNYILVSYCLIFIVSFFYEKDYARNDKKILQEADIDFLTEIPNRRGLQKLMQPLFKSGNFSFVVIDVDDFKKINDQYGHEGGDILLKEMSRVVSETVRKTDIFARWGGEEFVLALPDTKKENGAILAEKLRSLLEKSEFNNMKVTASFGVTDYQNDETFEELFKRADEGAYLAKSNGKNCVKIV
ncbi:MAG: diguanylate cyclase [Spirochaetia bacterium]|nr:diguanylate cyclase [Spirochaetia bacterium]